jgi:hypothetical protein
MDRALSISPWRVRGQQLLQARALATQASSWSSLLSRRGLQSLGPRRAPSAWTTHHARAAPTEVFRRDYRPLPFTVRSLELDVQLDDPHALVSSVMEVDVGTWDRSHGVALNCEDLELVSVQVNGVPVPDYTLEGDVLTIPASRVPRAASSFSIQTVSRTSPEGNTQLSGLYKSGGMYCTQVSSPGRPNPRRPQEPCRFPVRGGGISPHYAVL